jgi:hypothetical protein
VIRGRVAHASRVLVSVSRRNEILNRCHWSCFRASTKVRDRERALVRTQVACASQKVTRVHAT